MLRNATSRRPSRWRTAGAVALSIAAAVVLLVALLSSRVGNPTETGLQAAGQSEVHDHRGRPAHVYEGDCDRLGEVKYSLNPVGAGQMGGSEMADEPAMAVGDIMGSGKATAIEIGSITLAVPVDEIISDTLAVAIHRSESEYGVWVACGEVGGAMTGDGLAFGLRQQKESGLSGVAVLTRAGNETRVTIYLGTGLNGMVSAGPVASREQ